ncbi:hypothetical protein [Pseudoalteromonas sp. C12FD-1]|uniref:hypothetical protein n=1 Tax=Pseudoalteromonas sp. C12FD-1 TaxID=3131979 RepID=UPI00307D9A18|tara:strand:+ start:23 stop:673 length:651 start_codon:yes stop_codon:yes gene_type:complete
MTAETITYTNALGEVIAPFLLAVRSTGFFEVYVYLPLMTILAIFIFRRTYHLMMANGTFDSPLRQRYRYVILSLYFMICFFFTGVIAVAFKTMILEETDYTEAHWFITYVSYLHFYIASVSLAYIYLMRTNRSSLFSRVLSVYIQVGFLGAYLIGIDRIVNEPWVLLDPTSGLSGFYMFAIFGVLHFDVLVRLLQPCNNAVLVSAPTMIGDDNAKS